MIIRELKTKLPISNYANLYVVADFDRTITTDSSQTSWSILSSSNMVPKAYKEERNALYVEYRPIELDEAMNYDLRSGLIKEWYQKHIELFIKYQISEELFAKAARDLRIMQFRPGAKEFIDFLHAYQIPLIIISAGVGNFIETFLTNNGCYYDNIYVSSNKIIFKDGLASAVEQNIIHSLNKNEVSLPPEIKMKIANRTQVILLGDQTSDLRMVEETSDKTIIKVALYTNESFDEVVNVYDIIGEVDDTYYEIKDLLFKK